MNEAGSIPPRLNSAQGAWPDAAADGADRAAVRRRDGAAASDAFMMPGRTPGSWHYHLQKAEFEEFVWHDGSGRVHFAIAAPSLPGKRFRDRVWPVFCRARPKRQTTDAWDFKRMPLWHVPYERSLKKKLRVEAARRWWTDHPLTRQWDRVDEAIEATRGTLA